MTVILKVSSLGYENSEALKLGRFTNDCMSPNHGSSSYLHTDSPALDFLFLTICKNVCICNSFSFLKVAEVDKMPIYVTPFFEANLHSYVCLID